MTVQHVTAGDFAREVLQSELPVVVDFYAVWCGPCRLIAPVLEQFAQQYAGRVKVVKVDVDQEYGLAQQYGISGVPTLLFFHNGQVVDRVVGALPPHALEAYFARLAAQATPVTRKTP